MSHIADDILMHYGMPRRSGRYPYGSGEDPYQRGNRDFLGRLEELKKQGWKETAANVKEEFGMTLNEFRTQRTVARNERDLYNMATAKALQKDGLGPTEIGRRMGVNESTVRGWLKDPSVEAKRSKARSTADFIKERLKEHDMIDVGKDVYRELGVPESQFNAALKLLQEEGYPIYGGRVPQPSNPAKQTTEKIICVPGTEHKEIYDHSRVHSLKEYASSDGGTTYHKFEYPKSLDSKRLKIVLRDEIGPDGEPGIAKDGIVQLRRGVEDISLGDSQYAQVRILVDGTKYIKGMAVYSDNMPDGVDVIFNSNKESYEKALKTIKDDPENPFGSLIGPKGQRHYIDENGVEQLSLINKRADEGDWSEWKDALPSQFLSKQSKTLAKKQLNLAKSAKLDEFNDIMELTQPTIRKHYLEEFAENCDKAAVNLQAAALPGQKYHVIIPINSLSEKEVYAPKYENGTKLALIRYPHGGTFEIPILTVNNKNKSARSLLPPDVEDAVGINKSVADRLSGADFDGDTVMCIPTHDPMGRVHITNTDELDGLKGFDAKVEYAAVPGMTVMTKQRTGREMGVITNLITDMTLGGATEDELARAVRHSQVVIDAEKHKLDFKRSEIVNNIAGLRAKYQRTINPDGTIKIGGASTIISRAKSETSITKRQGTPRINVKGKDWYDPDLPEGSKIYKVTKDLYYPDMTYDKKSGMQIVRTTDGKKIKYDPRDAAAKDLYKPVRRVDEVTGEVSYTDKTGTIKYKTKLRTEQSTKMAATNDANTLVSADRHLMELIYADYANSMKALANRARLEAYNTKELDVNKSAAEVYSNEVASLKNKLNTSRLNSPREREALRRANAEIKKNTTEETTKEDLKKIRTKAMNKARQEVGAIARKDRDIEITDKEWEAIQAGAVPKTTLRDILANSEPDKLRERAMPRPNGELSTYKVNRIKNLQNSNYTIAEIAKILGVSASTVSKYMKGANK